MKGFVKTVTDFFVATVSACMDICTLHGHLSACMQYCMPASDLEQLNHIPMPKMLEEFDFSYCECIIL